MFLNMNNRILVCAKYEYATTTYLYLGWGFLSTCTQEVLSSLLVSWNLIGWLSVGVILDICTEQESIRKGAYFISLLSIGSQFHLACTIDSCRKGPGMVLLQFFFKKCMMLNFKMLRNGWWCISKCLLQFCHLCDVSFVGGFTLKTGMECI